MEIALIAACLVCCIAMLIAVVLLWRKLMAIQGGDVGGILREELRTARQDAAQDARNLREEVAKAQRDASEMLSAVITKLGDEQKTRLAELVTTTGALQKSNREELGTFREKVETQFQGVQNTLHEKLENIKDTVNAKLKETMDAQVQSSQGVKTAIAEMATANRDDQEKNRIKLEEQTNKIQASNEKKLEEMRKTVDEKLHETLEKRLGESFKQVSERLEAVHQGLGEMQKLATGVGDLKRVLSNVKERGTWGEYQLKTILEDIFTPDQYDMNFHPLERGKDVVEFAVKMPGRKENGGTPVWLPIDAKFPKEDYERLVSASQNGEADKVKEATKALLAQIKKCATDIHSKYINPPRTTDFAILFLPTEGLYAEVLREPGFHDTIQQRYKVLIAGPTTLSAILASLRVGFNTLAIEKRAHEVWEVLGAVKTEFGRFGAVLAKAQKQLGTVSKTLDATVKRTNRMQSSLKTVQQLSDGDADKILGLSDPFTEADGADDEPDADITGTETAVESDTK